MVKLFSFLKDKTKLEFQFQSPNVGNQLYLSKKLNRQGSANTVQLTFFFLSRISDCFDNFNTN